MNKALEKILGHTLGVILEHPKLNGWKTIIGIALTLAVFILNKFEVIDDTLSNYLLLVTGSSTLVGVAHKSVKGKQAIDLEIRNP
jgi:hypothetical protein